MKRLPVIVAVVFLVSISIVLGCDSVPISFDPPAKTDWAPDGCGIVPDPDLGVRTQWRNIHGDAVNTDEVSIALAPVFQRGWRAEELTFNYGGPVFDKNGNLYFTPLLPPGDVILISLDPSDGSRRWTTGGTGSGGGGGTPMVLDDPDNPGEEIIYVGLYDRAFAARTDGSMVWDISTGLTPTGDFGTDTCFGVNYLPSLDAIAGITGDGYIYVLDRATGASLMASPHQLPGERSPSGTSRLPPFVLDAAFAELTALMGDLPPGFDVTDLVGMLLGTGVEVANFFSVDPASGRLWVAATAPDGEDGSIDGVSEYGALYGLDVVFNGGTYEIVEGCHRYFSGGSASAPALRVDGSRLYVGDNDGNLIALDSSCGDVWTYPVGAQVAGSVGVSSDNGELYVSGERDIVQILDMDTYAVEGWRANLTVYTPGIGQMNLNSNLYSIAANGIGIQAGAGYMVSGYPLLTTVGIGQLDRATGEVRYFIDDLDETIAVMSTGPDGALYIGSSPLRRAFARALFPTKARPLEGGIRKYEIVRADLLIRDAACAAAARAANADANQGICSDSAAADLSQIQDLIDQARATSGQAIADGDLSQPEWDALDASFTLAETNLALPTLDIAMGHLDSACSFFAD